MLGIKLTGKVAIVTGGASGLGRETSLKLAEAGASVVVSDINIEAATEVTEQIKKMGQKSIAVKTNVVKSEDLSNLIDVTVKELGKLDIMVNCAGIGFLKPIVECTQDEIDKVLDIDLKGVIYGSREALKYMIPKKEGKIINFSSIAAKNAAPGTSIYGAAKSGVISFSKAIAREVARDNINVNVICPGIIKTPMWKNELKKISNNAELEVQNKIFNDLVEKEIPLNRPQEPKDIANLVVFLCSDLAKNITAQDINVDGGSVVF